MTKCCACKGIRTCLLCKPFSKLNLDASGTSRTVYQFCSKCEKAWDEDVCATLNHAASQTCNHTGHSINFPGVKVLCDFVSEKDEEEIVKLIDRVPWVDSQSGRRKQDYGPKVNFKKKKIKTSVFSGLPPFSQNLITSMQSIDILRGFEAVELCNLEYVPERGAGIDPHKDDDWLWGERLVTLNLLADTRYTMTFDPGSVPGKVMCSSAVDGEQSEGDNGCLGAKTSDLRVSRDQSASLYKQHHVAGNSQAASHQAVAENVQPTSGNGFVEKSCWNTPTERNASVRNDPPSHTTNGWTVAAESARITNGITTNLSAETIRSQAKETTPSQNATDQSGVNLNNKEVEIALPRRGLIVLYGPARTEWSHGIKSSHINCRRIGITMRELTPLFQEGGELEHIGREMLEKAKSFQGLSVAEYELQGRCTQNETSSRNACSLLESNNNKTKSYLS